MKTQENESGTKLPFEISTFKKVLIAMDYNPNAQKLAEAGLSLARNLNAELKLLHVLVDNGYYTALDFNPEKGYGDFSPAYFHGMIDADGLRNASYYFLNKMKEYLCDENLETIVEEGDPADVIVETSKRLKVDVIVIGSHSRRWLEQIVMGRVTEKVLRKTEIPVFIVPTGVR